MGTDTRKKRTIMGCIADDFTGASDAASFIQRAGIRVILVNGTPHKEIDVSQFDAIVIALKTRTMPAQEAVKESMEAVQWLENHGVTHLYSKYCSTFDSTAEGNIGPIADAVMEYLNVRFTLLCPALPVNGRIVKEGNLYVNGELLSESPMKNHPLTPMRDSRIKHLIEAQSQYKAYETYESNEAETGCKDAHYYLIPDYENEKDAKNIIQRYGDLKFLTGGSGLLEFWVSYLFKNRRRKGKGVILAGSCSKATLEQIMVYMDAGNPSYKIVPKTLTKQNNVVQSAVDFIESHSEEYVLVYSSDTSENVREVQALGKERMAALIEQTLSEIAFEMVRRDYQTIIVAGGETSGAVTKRLGYSAFDIGESVAPGVPLMTPVENETMNLVLKSGNFGQPDFFQKAIEKAEEREASRWQH